MNSSHTFQRTKSVLKWIESDPMRREWYGADCPECGTHSLSFVLSSPNGPVGRVECMTALGGCGWEVSRWN